MQNIYANQAASITELKKNPTLLIAQAEGQPIAILNHNVATAYLIPASTYEKIIEALDDSELEAIIYSRINDNKKSVKVDLNDL